MGERERASGSGRPHTRIAVALIASIAAIVGSMPTQAGDLDLQASRPQVCADPTLSTTLFAERLGKNKIGYGLTPETAAIPGPTLEMEEGDCLSVNLVNNTDRQLSMHAHGVDYTVASDGTPLNDSCVKPGRSLTYVFQAHAPTARPDGTIDPGSAGYWHYHDHCMGTPHGTDGVRQGLFGALIVRRANDPRPDRDPFVVVMSGTQINLKRAPRTPTFEANVGERVEFVVIGHGTLFHTFHLHGHRWADNRTGTVNSLTSETQLIDNKTTGPADSFGFQVIAGEHVGPGAWMYHCHVQDHSDAGMSGMFVVKTPEGLLTEQTRSTLRAYRSSHKGQSH